MVQIHDFGGEGCRAVGFLSTEDTRFRGILRNIYRTTLVGNFACDFGVAGERRLSLSAASAGLKPREFEEQELPKERRDFVDMMQKMAHTACAQCPLNPKNAVK